MFRKSVILLALVLGGCATQGTHSQKDERRPSNAEEVCPEVLAASDLSRTAFTNLNSFDYVNHALSSVPGSDACVSAWPLSRNNYGYYRFLFLVGGNGHSYAFLYQDASVQAHHNVGRKPWVALDPAAAQDLIIDHARESLSKPPTAEVLLTGNESVKGAVQSHLEKIKSLDLRTLSVSSLPALSEAGRTYYLAVAFDKISGNVYSQFPRSHGFFVESTGNALRFFRTDAFGLEKKLDALLTETAREQRESKMPFADYLRKLSRP